MSVTADYSKATDQRRLAVRMRPDLVISPQSTGRRATWVVKDPVTLQYAQLGEDEYFILRQLDGCTSLSQIKSRYEQRFAPRKLSLERLHGFLGALHANGLVLAEAAGQGAQLHDRSRRQRKWALIGQWTNVLAFRLRGIDPERLLDRLYPWCRFFFSPWAVATFLLLAVSALLLVTVHFDALLAKLPGFQAFFSTSNLGWMLLTLAAIKVIHELGHGLACKHFGGECHEIGIMFLVFTPCLYCNVTDSWLLPDKWRRIAVSAAGMFVELGLASVCTFLWAFSEPGLLNLLSLNVMFICSVGTVFFNGNPLLRYDGYFILSDLVEVPNLAQQSRAVLRRGLTRLLIGAELPADRILPARRQGWLAAYAVASVVYRWVLIVAILWFVHAVLKPYGLEIVAVVLAIVVLGGMIAAPAAKLIAAAANPSWRRSLNRRRCAITAIAITILAVLVVWVPLPYRVAARAVIEPAGAKHIYVSMPGRLVESVAPGQDVAAGDTLARLENLELELELERLAGQRNAQRQFVQGLKARRSVDPEAAAQIPAAQQALDDLDKRLETRRRDLAELNLAAPASGTVIPPPRRTAEDIAPDNELQSWSGTPLETRNRGCYLPGGSLLCLVGDPKHLEAVLAIDQGDVQFVSQGQQVRIQIDQLAGRILSGTISEIAEMDLQLASRDQPERVDRDAVNDPRDSPLEQTVYRARVALDDADAEFLIGAEGLAKISVDPQSLGRRLTRYLARTFRFRL